MSASNDNSPDPYEADPIIEEVSEFRREELQKQAMTFAKESKLFAEEPFFSQKYYYLVSAKWLRRWKRYVSYDQISSGKQPTKIFGCGKLPHLNEDIVESTDACDLGLSNRLNYLDIKLKSDLAEHRDYEFINERIWDKIFESYDGHEVKRYVVDTPDGQKVQIYYKTIKFIPLWNNLLKDVEQQRISKLKEISFQYSHHSPLKDFLNDIEVIIQKWARKQCYGSSFPRQNFLRVWILPEGIRKSILYNTLQQGCKANPSFTYKLFLQGDIQDEQAIIRDIDFLPDVLIVLEMREMNQKWMFFNMKHKLQAQCSYCKKTNLLNYVCSCKHAVYCSHDCKQYDKGHHKYRCPNDAESDQEEKQLAMNQNSRKGLSGLRNLGNTCFMNSGLQCLSHIPELTNYFLTEQYLKHVNKTNPLGTQGQLSNEYAKMIKHLWFGQDSSFSPTHLKKSIAKFQPMFSGYNQHDSGELITYLLDGLHEDLNRVIEKPYTQTKDYDGRPDNIIAKQSWQTYLKRNQSIVVDLMYGQYKSMVQCPNESCQYLSITFDPFSVCSLPLVDNSKKHIELVILKEHIYSKKVNFTYTVEKDYTLQEKLDELRTLINAKPDSKVLLYIASYTSCQAIQMGQPVDDVRKQYKYRTIFIRQLQPFQKPEEDIKVMLGHVIPNPYYTDQTYRKNIVPFQMVYANVNITNKEFYHLVIKRYSKILESLSLPTNPDELLSMEEEKEPIRLLLITTSRYFSCTFCDKKNCPGCKLPYDDKLFRDHIHYNPESEYSRDKRIEMELYWRKNQKEVEKVFDQLSEQSDNMKYAAGVSSYKPPSVTIQECLDMFEKEEVLGKDNEWYCPKCQDFVLAKKQMKIFKAPKILIFCLKRFKRKDYFSQKIGTLVDFPVNGLDMSGYVCNRDLPSQYFKDDSVKMQIEKGSLNYDLIGISNHFGSTGGGHYTGYCKDPTSGDWYDFDDSSVSKLKGPEDVVSQSAYILFYKRRE